MSLVYLLHPNTTSLHQRLPPRAAYSVALFGPQKLETSQTPGQANLLLGLHGPGHGWLINRWPTACDAARYARVCWLCLSSACFFWLPRQSIGPRHTFISIFRRRDWPANDESYDGLQSSGPGAMLRNAQGAIATLHSVVSRLKTHLGKANISLLDAPCGDFQWMRKFVMTRDDVHYTGVDVVPELIAHNAAKFGRRLPRVRFLLADVVKDGALQGGYDLIFSRDMLQHLWKVDAAAALGTWSASGSRFLLTTNYPDTKQNEEVQKHDLGGRRSSYNLEMAPFSLRSPICSSYDWSIEHLALWSLPLTQKDTAM
ncbi:hypothetical protein LSAT2_013931 [Lamellibrachia satsuma]|nr:hypothetical protein LSAT2_013931 [Lamellibrachia satsuma]